MSLVDLPAGGLSGWAESYVFAGGMPEGMFLPFRGKCKRA